MNNPIILIDSRETNQEIKDLFNNQDKFSVSIEKLELGDIVFGNTLIERKTLSDFYNSLRKKDFWTKLFDAKEAFSKVFLWIDSSPFQSLKFMGYANKYIFNTIQGTKVTLDSLDITWREFDKEEASEYFLNYFQRMITDKKFTPKPEVKKQGKSLVELKQQVLMSIPKIGYNKAIKLMKEYKSLGDIVNESKDSEDNLLKQIEKIFWK